MQDYLLYIHKDVLTMRKCLEYVYVITFHRYINVYHTCLGFGYVMTPKR